MPGKIAGMVDSKKNSDWTKIELAAIVRSYLGMLALELAGQRYNKTAFRDALIKQINGSRSKGSIEFKHCNISAVMQVLGYPSIQGYKPRNNFQNSLLDEVATQLTSYPQLIAITESAVTQPAHVINFHSFEHVQQEAPEKKHIVAEANVQYGVRHPARRDYLAQEARNQSLGNAGEQFVVAYERWKLAQYGLHDLADRVEHVALTLGDGLGFDVRSFDQQGHEQLIEVKTTSFSKETPFFVTHNELEVSKAEHDKYLLYRVYAFRKQPQFFALRGSIEQHCYLDPITYRASF